MQAQKKSLHASGADRGSVSRYLADIERIPLADHAEQDRLAQRIRRGERSAANRLVEASLGFVVKVAAEYRNCGLPFEDLVNEGNVGLVEAARRFDPDRGARFITYAVWWIRKSILRALTDTRSVVRLSETRHRQLREVRKVEALLRQELGRAPLRKEIAEHLRTTPRKLEKLLQHTGATISLDVPVTDEVETPLVDRLECGRESAEDRMSREQLLDLFARAFSRLPAKQQTILILRAGLDGEPPRTLREVGAQLGVSRERVRQIEAEARNLLRKWIGDSMQAGAPG